VTENLEFQTALGIDFSGAANAGNHLWLAQIDSRSRVVRSLLPAKNLPGGAQTRSEALKALVAELLRSEYSLIGADFPVTLPAPLMPEAPYPSLLDWIGTFQTPQAFKTACNTVNEGRELKRACDIEAKTPFSAYNLRLYRQTYWGLKSLVAPLCQSRSTSIAPVHLAPRARRVLIEACPASTLKAANLYRSYKGKAQEHRQHRQVILDWFIDNEELVLTKPIGQTIVDDPGGDALDALIAATTALQISETPDALLPRVGTPDAREGRVYF